MKKSFTILSKKSIALAALLLLFGTASQAQQAPLPLPAHAEDLCLIPTPQSATLQKGSLSLENLALADCYVMTSYLLAPVTEELSYEDPTYLLNIIDNTSGMPLFLKEPHILWKESKEREKFLKTPAKEPRAVIELLEQPVTLPQAGIPAENMNEYYHLQITPQEIIIKTYTKQGLMMAYYTIVQLVTAYGNTLPCLTIEDWPAYTWRGWMDDISRGPIPNMDFLNKATNILALYKYNYWTLYTEHTLVNPTYPDIAPKDGITAKEIAQLTDRENRGRYSNHLQRYPNTTLQPMGNLQVLAHAEKTLRIPFYNNLKDSKYNFNPGREKTYDYLDDILTYAADTVYHHSPLFNINCDETEALGSGYAHDYVSKLGTDDAYCQHINRVYDILKPYKKEVLMWGDIVAKKPEMIRSLPKELQYIVWNYAPADSYTEVLKPFKEARDEMGIDLWVAPSVAHWSVMLPNPANYMKNIACLARDGRIAGARGFMNTSWDDNGEALFDNSWHGMLWGAEMAWNPLRETNPTDAKEELKAREARFNRNFNVLFCQGHSLSTLTGSHPDEVTNALQSKDVANILYRVGALESDNDIADWYLTSSIYESLYNFFPSMVDDNMATRIKRATTKLNQLEQEVLAVYNRQEPEIYNPLHHVLYAIHHMQATAQKSALRRQLYLTLQSGSLNDRNLCKSMAADYMQALHKLKIEYLRLWDYESRQYSRDLIEARFDALGREVLELDRHVFFEVKQSNIGTMLNTTVSLRTLYGDKEIYYTLDGHTPTKGDRLYTKPFSLDHSATIRAVAYNEYNESVITERYLLHHKATGCRTKLNSSYSTYRDTYTGGGDNALTDGQMGSDLTYNDGHWQGYWGNNIDVEIDLGKATSVNHISMRFLQNTFDWILSPTELLLYTSTDGKTWKEVRKEQFRPEWSQGGNIVHSYALRNLNLNTRHLRIVAPNPGKLPVWHPSKGNDSYLFTDEIVVE